MYYLDSNANALSCYNFYLDQIKKIKQLHAYRAQNFASQRNAFFAHSRKHLVKPGFVKDSVSLFFNYIPISTIDIIHLKSFSKKNVYRRQLTQILSCCTTGFGVTCELISWSSLLSLLLYRSVFLSYAKKTKIRDESKKRT